MNKLILLAVLSCTATVCSDAIASECVPGHTHGPWKTFERPLPTEDEIRAGLVGKTLPEVRRLLGAPHRELSEKDRQTLIWVFDNERVYVERDCKGPDKSVFRQAFLIVKTEVRDGIVVSCVTQMRGALGERRLSNDEAITMPEHPLDYPPRMCAKPGAAGTP